MPIGRHIFQKSGGVENTPGVQHRSVKLTGGPVSVYVAGEVGRPCAVLLHGAMYDEARFVWDQLFSTLSKNYRVYAVDIPRHGKSRPWSGHLGHDRLTGILADTFRELRLEKFALIGLSMGGGLSIGYAARHPEQISCLILFEPGGLGEKLQRHFLTWLYIHTPGTRRLMNRLLVHKNRRGLLKILRGLFVGGSEPTDPDRLVTILKDEIAGKARYREADLDDWQSDAIGLSHLTWNLLDIIPALDCPTLWLRGAESSLVRQEEIERAVALAGDKAEFMLIANAGHLLPLERPAEVNRAVMEYLARHL